MNETTNTIYDQQNDNLYSGDNISGCRGILNGLAISLLGFWMPLLFLCCCNNDLDYDTDLDQITAMEIHDLDLPPVEKVHLVPDGWSLNSQQVAPWCNPMLRWSGKCWQFPIGTLDDTGSPIGEAGLRFRPLRSLDDCMVSGTYIRFDCEDKTGPGYEVVSVTVSQYDVVGC